MRISARVNTTGMRSGSRYTQSAVETAKFSVQKLLIKKQQRAHRLILGGSRNILLCGEMSQECGDLLPAHVTRVALAVEKNEAPNPVEMSLLGTQTITARPHKSAELIEQFGLAGSSGLRCNRFQFPRHRK